MKKNPGFYFSKLINRIYRPALRNCRLGQDARVGSESNCIGMQLGKHSYLGKACIVHNVTIGSFCSIANYCTIGGGRHELDFVSTSPVFCEGGNTSMKRLGKLTEPEQIPTTIGNDVWIGENCYVKAGVNIGDGAVLGAHAVVTRDVPPYAIVAGCPARVLRYRFDETTVAKLLAIRWWDWDDEKLARNAALFDAPQKLIEAVEKGELR